MQKSVLHKADSRGLADHGWLKSYHTFSFSDYRNPERMNFGVLRVLNDDKVAAGAGFGAHAHDNMEIVSIPLEGDLEHKDSMGNTTVIKQNDVQIMSAGTGIRHSEKNASHLKEVKFLQIWVMPNKRDVPPRYGQISLSPEARHNKLEQIISPNADDAGTWIHQDAWFSMGKFDKDFSIEYSLKKRGNGVYAFVLSGDFTINEQALNERDGFGIWEVDKITITANSANAELLLMDVPMSL